jgi:hypothetical protein
MDLLHCLLDGEPYALRLDAVADVTRAGAIQPVPLSPPAVKGLAERRGRPIAVIDLPRLLGGGGGADRAGAHLIRLARPLDGTALYVPAEVFSGEGRPAAGAGAPEDQVFIDGRAHVLLDPEALVRRAAAFV